MPYLMWFVYILMMFVGTSLAIDADRFDCSDDVLPNAHYIRMRDSEFDEAGYETKCTYTRKLDQTQNLMIGYRMTKEFDTKEDPSLSLTISNGPIKIEITEHRIKTSAYGFDVSSCTLETVQDESSPTFSPLNVYYLYFEKVEGNKVNIKYALPDIDRWFLCGNSVIRYKSRESITFPVDFTATSRIGHNIDIVSVDVNSVRSPWDVKMPVKEQIKHHEQHKAQASSVNVSAIIADTRREVSRTWYVSVFAILLNVANFIYVNKIKGGKMFKDHII